MHPAQSPILIAAVLLVSAGFVRAADTYTLDSRHTFPVFEVSHYGFSIQRGRFNKVTGKLELDAANKRGSVEATIDMTSVDMGLEAWDAKMRGDDFFKVDKHPTARFVATDFTLDPDRPQSIVGELTLLGISRPVAVQVTQWRCAKHPVLPRELCGADIETSFRRSEFGMTNLLPGVGDEVRISVPVEAIKTSP